MKKLLRLLALTAALVLSLCVTAMAEDTAAADAPAVLVNGQAVEFTDAVPQIVDGRTYIPLRSTFTALGFADADITWDGETRTATAVKGDLTITLTEGENTVTVTKDGESETLETDAAAYVDAATGRVLVPVRFVAQAAGCNVGWDGNTRTAIIDDTAAILAANTETYSLMERYLAYSKTFAGRNYNVTGDYTMDMTMGADDISVTGDYQMLTSSTAADFTTNMAFAGQTEGQDLAALFPNGLDFEMRFDMATGVYYLYSEALNEAAQTGATGVWYKMDLAAMLEQMGAQAGMDYNTLLELSQAAQDLILRRHKNLFHTACPPVFFRISDETRLLFTQDFPAAISIKPQTVFRKGICSAELLCLHSDRVRCLLHRPAVICRQTACQDQLLRVRCAYHPYFNGSGFPVPCMTPFLCISANKALIFFSVFLSCVCQYR